MYKNLSQVLFVLILVACSSKDLSSNLLVTKSKPTVTFQAPVTVPETALASFPSAVALSVENQLLPTSTPVLTNDFWMVLPVIPTDISEKVREIYQRGILMGNNPQAFSKIGDCNSTTPYFLADYDLGSNVYQLGEYAYLQPTIDYFHGSFGRNSLAAKIGLSTAGVLTPLWSDWKQCSNNETPLDCEFRLHHPSIAIISLGTNEAYDVKQDRSTFEGRLRRIIEHAIDQGVVPILSTKADNDEGDNYINYVTAKLALEYDLPLWNYWKAVQSLPQHGMRSADHLTFAPTKSYADFSKPEYLEYGMQMRNLTALQVLDIVRREITEPQIIATPSAFVILTASPNIIHQSGDVMVSIKDNMKLVYVPAGRFEMGYDSGNLDERPVHQVVLDDYWIDSTEVTNAMFAAFLNVIGNQLMGGTSWLDAHDPFVQVFEKDYQWQVQMGKQNFPIVGVSWYGAQAYCKWAGRRLPTEAEWEYGAKSTDGRRFPWGNEDLYCDHSQFDGCGKNTVAVGSLLLGVSPFGIYDMAGNVAEWVNDRYAEDYYQNSPTLNPTGPNNGYYRVIRGGYWGNPYTELRTTHRSWAGADKRDFGTGFRCALTN